MGEAAADDTVLRANPLPPPKRISVAALLAALFGPLGMFYSTPSGALTMLAVWDFWSLACCLDGLPHGMDALLLSWPMCILWAAFAAQSWNEQRR